MGSAECHADCQAQASAQVTCPPPQANVIITGDDALYGSFQSHLTDIGTAYNLTVALKDPIAKTAAKTADTFTAIGNVGAAGITCIASQTPTVLSVNASISVSVSAQATVSGTAG